MKINSINKHSNLVKNILKRCKDISSVIPIKYMETSPHICDFSDRNKKLISIDLNNKKKFISYINKTLEINGCIFGVGGYGENRIIYRRSNLFENNIEPRTVHLGIDVWMPAKTPVYSPLEAIVHSFKDNNNLGDYGPTIILQHYLHGVKFYTLYGHLSRMSLKKIKVGMRIKKGQQIATLGNYDENGQWPSHLHFQIISNLLRNKGDFPGVATVSSQKNYLALCPDPNLILKIKALEK